MIEITEIVRVLDTKNIANSRKMATIIVDYLGLIPNNEMDLEKFEKLSKDDIEKMYAKAFRTQTNRYLNYVSDSDREFFLDEFPYLCKNCNTTMNFLEDVKFEIHTDGDQEHVEIRCTNCDKFIVIIGDVV